MVSDADASVAEADDDSGVKICSERGGAGTETWLVSTSGLRPKASWCFIITVKAFADCSLLRLVLML
jgi:hypothetical protein